MDWNQIDRLRDPGFAVVRRGYDRHEVDRLLDTLVEWLETDAATDLGELTIKRKLEHVGKSAARILVTTEEEAEQLLRVTQEECAKLRKAAETASEQVRREADEYATAQRAKADADADKARAAARAEAKRRVDEAERRRAEIEAAVRELQARRDGVIEELDRLRGELATTLGTHQPEPAKPRAAADGAPRKPKNTVKA